MLESRVFCHIPKAIPKEIIVNVRIYIILPKKLASQYFCHVPKTILTRNHSNCNWKN